MKNKDKIRVGIVQFDVKLGDIDFNTASAFNAIKQLADQGADMAVLPEMWSCGFDNTNLYNHANKTSAIINALSQMALKYDIIIIGSLPESHQQDIFNTSYVIDKNGAVAGSYRKVHLFSPTNEDQYYSSGNKAVVCETSLGNIGLMICYDLRFPELCRKLTDKGADFVVVSAQWPKVRLNHWNVLIKARAIENQLFVIAVNRCGKDPKLEYAGHSSIISPTGDIVTQAFEEADAIVADIDLELIKQFRDNIPCLKDRKPLVYAQ